MVLWDTLEAYLESCQTSTKELFSENNYGLKAAMFGKE